MEGKFDKYAAGSLLRAKSLARNDGHIEAPVYEYCVGGEWTVFYPATNPVATLARLRTAQPPPLAGRHRPPLRHRHPAPDPEGAEAGMSAYRRAKLWRTANIIAIESGIVLIIVLMIEQTRPIC